MDSPESGVTWNHCVIKHISRRNIKIHLENSFKEPLKTTWAHGVLYYKYTRYQKYAIDLWEDLCGSLAKTAHSYFMRFLLGYVMQYTNLNHTCPYYDHVILKVDNISMDRFIIEPLLPAGMKPLFFLFFSQYYQFMFFLFFVL